MESEDEVQTETWCRYTKRLLQELNLEEYWERDKAEEEDKWKKLVQERIHEREEKKWLNDMKHKPKLRTYRKIKSRLEQEKYLLLRDRNELTRLRSGTNRLRIEKGRWVKLKPEERTCVVCETDAIEDEAHFMLHCEVYERLRQILWTELESLFSCPVRPWTDEKKLNVLLGGQQCKKVNYNEVIKCVLRYIKKAMAMRKKMEEIKNRDEKEQQWIERLRRKRIRNKIMMRKRRM